MSRPGGDQPDSARRMQESDNPSISSLDVYDFVSKNLTKIDKHGIGGLSYCDGQLDKEELERASDNKDLGAKDKAILTFLQNNQAAISELTWTPKAGFGLAEVKELTHLHATKTGPSTLTERYTIAHDALVGACPGAAAGSLLTRIGLGWGLGGAVVLGALGAGIGAYLGAKHDNILGLLGDHRETHYDQFKQMYSGLSDLQALQDQ